MRIVFGDSFYFFALANETDPAHERARSFVTTYRGRLLTTAWILTELGDGLASPLNRPSFLAIEESMRTEPNIVLLPFSDESFRAGIELFRHRVDKS